MSKKQFFSTMKAQGLALTFDDVRLEMGRSHLAAPQVSIESRFSRRVPLKVPIVSAAMDTVTTSDMAIAMAKLGGIGVIHAGLSAKEQRAEVRRVKLHLNGLIGKPITVLADSPVADVLKMCQQSKFDFRTFPVVDNKNHLVGLLTQNDFDLCEDLSLSVKDQMTPLSEVKSAPDGTTVEQAFTLMKQNKKKTLPLVAKSGQVAGMYVLSDVLRIVRGNPEHYNLDDDGRLRVAAAVPTDSEAIERVREMAQYLDVAVIDSAQGDSDYAIETLKALVKFRDKEFPELDIVIGNISNGASALELAKAGADGIKVGQGPGSICSTRVETGSGKPQVTAVYECAEAVAGYDVPICADGGITNAGDISIAIAAGAHCVMMGGKLAGTKETPGEIIMADDRTMVKMYRGMGSPSAMRDSAASRKRYGSNDGTKPLPEGVEAYVPYQGPVADVMHHYILALRKSMGYVGSATIDEHRTNTGFWRVTNAGMKESRPHDVTIISRASSYSADFN